MATPTAGLGLKPQHHADALSDPAAGLWFEVHPENYMCAGGPRHDHLTAIRERRPLSLHGVGLSLAGDERPDRAHLLALRALIEWYEPFLVSEHLAWSRRGGTWRPDLLPFLRTQAALKRIANHVDATQEALGRAILIENPSLYLALRGHELGETEFLAALCRQTGCGLLVDVNNVVVSANNLGFDAAAYIESIPAELVGEIHLAGHAPDEKLGAALLVDTHGAPVAESVWDLYARLIARIGSRPTLIERDDNIPDYVELSAERARAAAVLRAEAHRAAA